MRRNRGSLLLIFLFTTGLLAILVTGMYWTLTASMVDQSFTESQAAKKKVERGIEQIHKSEMERLMKDYISNSFSPTIHGFTAGAYQTALATATKWGLKTDTLKEAGDSNPGSLAVVLPDQVSYPPLSKNNPVSNNTSFGQHPLAFPASTDMVASLTASYTPTWSDKAFPYTRYVDCYREIPAVMIPLSASYNVNGLSTLDAITVGGGPVAFFGGDASHANAVVADSVATLLSSPATYPDLPELVSTYGVAAEKISEYDPSGTGAALRQEYSLDLNAIILGFDGTSLTVQSAPIAGTTVPGAITLVAFDNHTRVQIDLSTLPTTGNYADGKWYINCTTNAGKAGGIVLKDTGSGTGAAANVSIATNGMLYLWTYNRTGKTAVAAATSYGGVGLADAAGYDGTSATAALGFAFNGSTSAYTKSSTLSSTNSVGASPYTAGVSNSIFAGSLMGYYVTTSAFANSNSLHLIYTDVSGGSYVEGTSDKLDLKISTNGGGSMTANFTSIVDGVGTVTGDTTSTSPSNPGGSAIYGFLYSPATNEVFITINGVLALKKKLATVPSWMPSNVVMTFGAGVTISNLSAVLNPIGTLLTSPQTGASGGPGVATFYGGVAIGQGIASSLDNGATLNFSYKSAVGGGLENLCERILVHYPYFYKP